MGECPHCGKTLPNVETESDAEDAQDTENEQTEWDVDSIRESWDSNQVRLPDSLQRRFDAQYSMLIGQLTLRGVDREFGKDRHYKPLTIALGLRELNAMNTAEILDVLATLIRRGHLLKFDLDFTSVENV